MASTSAQTSTRSRSRQNTSAPPRDPRAAAARLELRQHRKDGIPIDIELSTTPLRTTAGELAGTIKVAADISDRKRLEQQLRHQAFHDVLTGLPNRALFQDRLEHALARIARSERLLAVLLLDSDGFKTINDSLGHAAGDELLGVVAERLRAAVRPGDTVARLGGDEFVVLLEDAADPGEAVAVAERLLATLAEPLVLPGRDARSSPAPASGSSPPPTRCPPVTCYATSMWPCTWPKAQAGAGTACSSQPCAAPPSSASNWKPTCGGQWNRTS